MAVLKPVGFFVLLSKRTNAWRIPHVKNNLIDNKAPKYCHISLAISANIVLSQAMANDVAKELEAARAKVAALETSLAKSRRQALAGLHKQHGFATVEDFLVAVKEASRGSAGRRGRPAKSAVKASAPTSGGKKRAKRSRISSEIKQSVKSLVRDGRTGAQIASELGISLPSVQNIKKELGLVKARG